MMQITLFVKEKFEIFLIIYVLICYKQLHVSVELKRSLADYFAIWHKKTVFFPPGLNHT